MSTTILNNGGVTFGDGTTQSTAASSAASTAAFTQANAAFVQANSSYSQANTVTINANAAFIQANAVYSLANTHTTQIAAAFTQANSSYAVANTANTAVTNSATKTAIQQNSYTFVNDTGTTNAYVVSYTPSITTLFDGTIVSFKANTTNTGACTLNVNGLGASPIFGGGHVTLQSGEIVNSGFVEVEWNTSLGGWVLLECTGGSVQVANATQSQQSVSLGQMNTALINIKGINAQVFTSNGTFTIPAGVTSVKAIVVGGSGGAGGTTNGGAGGGGAGGVVSYLTGLTAGLTISVIVGASGGAGSGTGYGGTGGTSSISSGTQSITTLTATGGGGGSGAGAGGGTGGAGSGGSININGQVGGPPYSTSVVCCVIYHPGIAGASAFGLSLGGYNGSAGKSGIVIFEW